MAGQTTMSGWWTSLKETASRWSEHKGARQGAALAYYSIFSIGPLIVIAISIAGLKRAREGL
jgi:membrane protein